LIEGGNSVAGGVSGSRIQLDVEFTAESTAGQVTEMRVDTSLPGGCMSGGLGGIPWEPFVPQKVYTTTAFGNFQGWYINVQYRDDAQNISSVYCDDISIEGMPPTPTR
jgi:hypothetical protein